MSKGHVTVVTTTDPSLLTTATGGSTTTPASSASLSSTGMFTLSNGASAALLNALHAEVYAQSQMMGYAAYQEATQAKVNADSASAAANGDITAAQKQSDSTTKNAYSQYAQAAGSIAGGITTFGGIIGSYVQDNFAGENSTAHETQLNTYKNTLHTTEAPTETELSTREGTSPERLKQMLEGNFGVGRSADELEEDNNVLKSMTSDERKTVLDRIESRLSRIATNRRTAQESVSQWTQIVSNLAQGASQFGSGAAQIAAAQAQAEQGIYQAQKDIYSNLQQQAASNLQAFDAKIKQMLDEEMSEFQAYINANTSMRG